MNVDSDELSAYIQGVLNGISRGITSGYSLNSGVRFQLGLSNEIKIEGGAKIIIAHVVGDKASKENATIEFEVVPRSTDTKNVQAPS